MTKFLLRAGVLALPFLVLVVTFELRFGDRPNNEYAVKRRLLEQAAPQVEVLTLGSSHGYYGFLPEYLGGRAFNLAGTAQTLYYDVALVRKYLPRLPALRTVILPVSDFSLEAQLDQSQEPWRCYYYARFHGLPHRARGMAGSIRNYSAYFLQARYYPFQLPPLVSRDMSADFDARGGIAGDPLAGGLPLTSEALKASARSSQLNHRRNARTEFIPENLALLDDFADFLHARHIRLILVTTPVAPEYREVFQPNSYYTRMQDAVRRFAARHGVGYFDHFADGRFGPDDFRDSSHLSYRGAIKFSQAVYAEAIVGTAGHP